jgi:hypothetical protein
MAKLRKTRLWRHREYPGIEFFYKINYMDDLLSRKENYTHLFSKLRDVFGSKKEMKGVKERQAVKKAKAIVYDFLDMMAHDLMHHNDYFVFPIEGFGYINIMKGRDEDMKSYPFYFETEGEFYCFRCVLSDDVIKNHGKQYLIQVSRRLRNELDDLILKKGYRYGTHFTRNKMGNSRNNRSKNIA